MKRIWEAIERKPQRIFFYFDRVRPYTFPMALGSYKFPQKMTELNVYGLKEWMDERMNGMYPCKWMSWMSMVWQDELSLILPSLQ